MAASTRNGRLSAAARVDRDRRIAEARDVEGLTWPAIAERFGIEERSARRAYHRFLEGVAEGEVADVDVEGAVHRVVRVHLAALSRLERLIEKAGESNAGVGVLRTASSVGLGLLDALSRTGYLPDPRDEAVRREIAAIRREAGKAFAVLADEAGVSPEVFERALAEAEIRARGSVRS